MMIVGCRSSQRDARLLEAFLELSGRELRSVIGLEFLHLENVLPLPSAEIITEFQSVLSTTKRLRSDWTD